MTPPVGGTTPAPYRPGSPFRGRTNTLPNLPQSPNLPPPPNPAVRRADELIEADLVVRALPRDEIVVQKPFRIHFTVSISAPVPPPVPGVRRKHRVLTLAVQHVQPLPPVRTSSVPSAPSASNVDLWSPRLPLSPGGFSTPSTYVTPSRSDFPESLSQRLLVASPRESLSELELASSADPDEQGTPGPQSARDELGTLQLPPPIAVVDSGVPPQQSKDVIFVGPSVVILPQMHLAPREDGAHGHGRNVSEISTDSEADSDTGEIHVPASRRTLASQDFELEFIPLRTGFANVGGLRILVVEDRLEDVEEVHASEARMNRFSEVRTLREWDIVAEVWVKSVTELLAVI